MPKPLASRLRPLSNQSIATKLVLIVAVFVSIIAALAAMVGFVIRIDAAAHAYIYGESLWSKGQKDAVYYLSLYASNREEDAYRRFHESIAVPLGDRQARVELDQRDYDVEVVRSGFLAGQNHPDDISNLIFLYRWFRDVEFVARPVAAWAAADARIEELLELAHELHSTISEGRMTDTLAHDSLARIALLNDALTPLEREFSKALADGARDLRLLLPRVMLAVTLLLLASGIAFSLLLARQMSEGILRLREGAVRVARGDFSREIEVSSHDELGELASAFNEMTVQRRKAEEELGRTRDQALEASRAKSEFLASMSHEIRTPMNSIIGVGDLLSETPLTEEQRGYVDRLVTAGNMLVGLISDILDLSRVEAGRIELEEIDFDVRALVHQTTEALARPAREKSLELRSQVAADVPAMLIGDPGRLRQVLTNLVQNAIKFTHRGTVSVRVELLPDRDPGSLRISVSDTGIGIPPGKREAVFESFAQADSSTTRKFGGTGLGLAICRRLVERMGGRIWVESVEGEGSTFFVEVRLRVPRAETLEGVPFQSGVEAPRPEASFPKRSPLRILLAEDSPDNRVLIQAFFRRQSDRIDIAENGEAALEMFKAGTYDLVLMDMQMPVMSGYDATRKIRAWEAETGRTPVPIIALTANAMKEDARRSLEVGCTLHLTKPIRKSTLFDAVSTVVT